MQSLSKHFNISISICESSLAFHVQKADYHQGQQIAKTRKNYFTTTEKQTNKKKKPKPKPKTHPNGKLQNKSVVWMSLPTCLRFRSSCLKWALSQDLMLWLKNTEFIRRLLYATFLCFTFRVTLQVVFENGHSSGPANLQRGETVVLYQGRLQMFLPSASWIQIFRSLFVGLVKCRLNLIVWYVQKYLS